MPNTLVHCQFCNENIPIMEFDISYHGYGKCKELPQKEYEKLSIPKKYGAEFSTFLFLGLMTFSVFCFSLFIVSLGDKAFWVLGVMISFCVGFIIYANLKLRSLNDSSPKE